MRGLLFQLQTALARLPAKGATDAGAKPPRAQTADQALVRIRFRAGVSVGWPPTGPPLSRGTVGTSVGVHLHPTVDPVPPPPRPSGSSPQRGRSGACGTRNPRISGPGAKAWSCQLPAPAQLQSISCYQHRGREDIGLYLTPRAGVHPWATGPCCSGASSYCDKSSLCGTPSLQTKNDDGGGRACS